MGSKVDTPTKVEAAKGVARKAQRRSSGQGELTSDGPLYLQVTHILKGEILSGAFPVGAQLPTEDELCERFKVSRFTVREALRRLREDSLVTSRQGAGTVVAPPPPVNAYVHKVMSINDLLDFASGTRLDIQSTRMIPVDATLAERIGVKAGDEWLAVEGFRHAEGDESPVCWTECYIHRDFAMVGRLLRRHTGPIFPLIEDLFGKSIVEVRQEIAATLITPLLAGPFKLKAGTPALEVRRTYKLDDGQIAQVTVNTHPATLFRHSMTMRKVADDKR